MVEHHRRASSPTAPATTSVRRPRHDGQFYLAPRTHSAYHYIPNYTLTNQLRALPVSRKKAEKAADDLICSHPQPHRLERTFCSWRWVFTCRSCSQKTTMMMIAIDEDRVLKETIDAQLSNCSKICAGRGFGKRVRAAAAVATTGNN